MNLSDLAMIYYGLAMLPILLSARAIGISMHYKRLPKLRELFSSKLDLPEKDQKWLKIAKWIFIWWALIFFAAWLLDVHKEPEEYEGQNVKLFVIITMAHIAQLGQTLRSILFNIEHYDSEIPIIETNSQYLQKASIFPGFKDPVRASISMTTIVTASMLVFVIFYL